MRVRSQAEGFLVAAIDRYTGRDGNFWNEQAVTVKRPSWSYQIFHHLGHRTKEVVLHTVSEFTNLVPALSKTTLFSHTGIAVDGGVVCDRPWLASEDLTYTVISEVPYRDRSLFTTSLNQVSQNIQNYYLQVPQIGENAATYRGNLSECNQER